MESGATLRSAISRTETLSISEIAWLLGYQDIGAFSHAYKQWTGTHAARGCFQSALIPAMPATPHAKCA